MMGYRQEERIRQGRCRPLTGQPRVAEAVYCRTHGNGRRPIACAWARDDLVTIAQKLDREASGSVTGPQPGPPRSTFILAASDVPTTAKRF